MSIDVKSEQGDIQYQAGNRNGRDLAFISSYKSEKICYTKKGEFNKIIGDKA
jgi:hypothetical protein